jgi:aspartate aminotransferase
VEFSQRIQRIAVSPTLAVMMEAEKYKARGVDVVDFGPGEPDFPTPEHIKRGAVRALEENRTKYTATGGIAPLRQAIVEWHAQQFGSAYMPAECVVTVGGKHAIFNAISVLLNAGDEVLIPTPYWVSYPDIVKYVGGRAQEVPTHAEDGFRLRAAAVEGAIVQRTRMLIVNSPNNPTGAVVPPDEFERIADVCRRRNLWLMSDECYSHFTYGDARPYSIAAKAAKEQAIIVGSLSKTFAMTGWRMGYALGPQPLVEAIIKLQSQSTSNPTSITQYAALEALRGPMDSVHAMLAEYARRRTRILEGLRALPGVTCPEPQGAFYAFPNVQKYVGNGAVPDTTALARRLLEQAHIAVVPGEAFGAPGYLRISYATSMERIEEGLRRLAEFLRALGSGS